MIERVCSKRGIEEVKEFTRAFREFENEEEDNGTVEWSENFNSFERYKKRTSDKKRWPLMRPRVS